MSNHLIQTNVTKCMLLNCVSMTTTDNPC